MPENIDKPGSWRNDNGKEIVPGKTSSLDKRLREKAEKIKTYVTSERIKAVLVTEDLRRTFDNIRADTFSLHGLAVLEKQRNALEIREKKILSEVIMKNYPTVYIGAGVDVEYPLILGARKIIMVDPELKNVGCLERLRQKVRKLTDKNFTENESGFNFEFDFGSGKEKVNIQIDPRFYAEKATGSLKKERFVPPREIGMLLAFQSEDPAADQETLGNLVAGGYVLSNRSLEIFVSEYFAQYPEQQKRFGAASQSEKCLIFEALYRNKGFESIKIESFENDFSQTLLQKSKPET